MVVCLRVAAKWVQSVVRGTPATRVSAETAASQSARKLSGISSDITSSSVRARLAVEKADVLANYWESHTRKMNTGLVRDASVALFVRRQAAYTLEPGRAMPNGLYLSDVIGQRPMSLTAVSATPTTEYHADSVVRKRRKKMRKHKYEKMRKRQRFARMKLGQ